MNEAQWLGCVNPGTMLDFLEGRISDRKLRLFGCACCRRIWHLVPDERSRKAVEVAEQYADQLANEEKLHAAWAALQVVFVHGPFSTSQDIALRAVTSTAAASPFKGLIGLARDARNAVAYHAVPDKAPECAVVFNAGADEATEDPVLRAARAPLRAAEEGAQADLLRDLVGNPFHRAALNRSWLSWNSGAIPRLAQMIYKERDFSAFSALADALQNAGCVESSILDHCRGPGPHVRGCWVLDLLLEKPCV